MDKSVV